MTQLGPYVLLEELGRGGMGAVWRARDPGLDRLVAIKVLLAPLATPADLERFRREALAQSRLRHPAIVGVLGHGTTGTGQPYLVLELVEGENLAARLRRDGPLEPRAAVRLVAGLARAAHYAHSRGVLHRDLKASNVLLAADGGALLIDFGLAALTGAERLTTTGEVAGTPACMAPEQALGERGRVGPKTDVHGLGVVLYEALTGRPPFEGPSVVALLAAVAERTPLRPSEASGRRLDPRLDALVLRCLEKDPAQRWPSAEALAVALEALLGPSRAFRPGLALAGAAALLAGGLGHASGRLTAAAAPPAEPASVTSRAAEAEPAGAPADALPGGDRGSFARQLLEEAKVAVSLGGLEQARRLLDGALALGAPWEALHVRAVVRARLGDEAGMRDDLRALGRRPEPEALVLAARCLALTDDWEGLEVAERAVAATAGADARALGARALARDVRGEGAGALADVAAALRRDEGEVLVALTQGALRGDDGAARLEAVCARAAEAGDVLVEAAARCALSRARTPDLDAATLDALRAALVELDRALAATPGHRRSLGQRANLRLVVAIRTQPFDRDLLRAAAEDAGRLFDLAPHVPANARLRAWIHSFLAFDPRVGLQRAHAEAARAALTRGLERSPKAPELLVDRAELLANLGDFNGAAADATAALALGGDPVEADRATALLGRLRWRRGAPDEAVALLTRFIDDRQVDPPHALAERAIARLLLSEAELAERDVERALQTAPRQARSHLAAGRLLVSRASGSGGPSSASAAGGRADLRKAARAFEQALKLSPNLALAMSDLTLVQANLRALDTRQAEERLAAVAGLEPWSAQHLVNLCLVLEADGATERVDELLDKAVALEPASPLARKNRGRRRVERDPQGAVTDLLLVTERQAWNAEAWYLLAAARQRLGDAEGALREVERCVALVDRKPGDLARDQLAMALRLRAHLRLNRREVEAGLADAERAVALGPGDAEALWLRAKARRLKGDEAGSLADLEAALELRPGDVAYRLDRAEALLRGDEAAQRRGRAELDALAETLDAEDPELRRVRALQARQGR